MKKMPMWIALLLSTSLIADPSINVTNDSAQAPAQETPAKASRKKQTAAAPATVAAPAQESKQEIIPVDTNDSAQKTPAQAETKTPVKAPAKASRKKQTVAAPQGSVSLPSTEALVPATVAAPAPESKQEPVAAQPEKPSNSSVSEDATGGKQFNLKLPVLSRRDKKAAAPVVETTEPLASSEVVSEQETAQENALQEEVAAPAPVTVSEAPSVAVEEAVIQVEQMGSDTTSPMLVPSQQDNAVVPSEQQTMQESTSMGMEETHSMKQESNCEKSTNASNRGLFANIAIATASAAVVVVAAILGTN